MLCLLSMLGTMGFLSHSLANLQVLWEKSLVLLPHRWCLLPLWVPAAWQLQLGSRMSACRMESCILSATSLLFALNNWLNNSSINIYLGLRLVNFPSLSHKALCFLQFSLFYFPLSLIHFNINALVLKQLVYSQPLLLPYLLIISLFFSFPHRPLYFCCLQKSAFLLPLPLHSSHHLSLCKCKALGEMIH